MLRKLKETMIVLVALMAMLIAAPLIAYAASTSMTVTATDLQAVDVAYIYVTSNDYGDLELMPLTSDNSFSKSRFSYGSDRWWDSYSGYVVFFVKPQQGTLLTKLFVSNSQPQLYPLEEVVDNSNIRNYHRIKDMVELAESEGYIAAFGFSRGSDNNGSSSFYVSSTGTLPILNMEATSDVSGTAVVGDDVTFTVRITPEVPGIPASEVTIDDLKIDKLTLNDESVNDYDIVDNHDGTYTITV
ncbi:MAG: hypothetical protein IJC70_02685, partial [Firmicutes bacterium]|nr:hypothetical protein [Bacillota bacterium]